MTTPSNEQSLEGLVERVRQATEPDDELDATIWLAVIPGASRNNVMAQWPDEKPIWEYADPERNLAGRSLVPSLTASIDAALALVERVLPEHDWILGHTNGGLAIHCQLGPDADKMAFGETPALAILLALLSSLKDDSK